MFVRIDALLSACKRIVAAVLGALVCTVLVVHATAAEQANPNEVQIVETFERLSVGTANVYTVEEIDGERMRNLVNALNQASYGRSGVLWWRSSIQRMPARPTKLRIAGYRHYGMPVQQMVRPDFMLEGEVEFTPVTGGVYFVRGCIDRAYQSVWIEDRHGTPVSAPLEQGVRSTACAPPATATTPQALFDRTSGGETHSVLVHRLGDPSRIIEFPDNSTLFSGPKQKQIEYRYEGRGALRLVDPEIDDAEPFVVAVTSDSMQAAEVGEALRLIVERGDIALFRGIVMGLVIRGVSDTETLDALAARAWRERTSHEPLTVDTIAHVFGLIGKSGRTRYRTLLEYYRDDDSRDDKLERYAEKALDSLPQVDEPQFPLTDAP